MKEKKKKYRVVPCVENTGLYGVTKLYKVQKKILFWWWDETNPKSDKGFMDRLCEELNNS
ncbi:MAG: hypothetical protein RBT65_16320 [Methanolobus sp.]|nr:hypothetical protein [Methanolobus sp.]